MTVLVIVVVLTILISASCSLYEAVLYSARMSTLESLRKRAPKNQLVAKMIELKKNISKPIAAILILNTIANTAGATIAGMYAAEAFGGNWVPAFSVAFTLGILFFSEIIPKTIGVVKWQKIWKFIVIPVQVMKIGLYPLIFITEKFTGLFTKDHKPVMITEDEILAMVHMGTAEGEISKEEGNIVKNIIELENRKAPEVMTPRPVIFMLDAEMTVAKAAKAMEGKGFSRIPIYENDPENIVGYVLAQQVNAAETQSRPGTKLRSIAKPMTLVPETKNCLELLIQFLKQRLHMAIVIDEYGGVDGLITLEDILETMLGTEIVDETDQAVDLQEEARKQAAKRIIKKDDDRK